MQNKTKSHRNSNFNRTSIRIYSFALAVALISIGIAISVNAEKRKVETLNNSVYSRAFAELVDQVCSINTQFEKMTYATSSKQIIAISADLIRQISSAKANLGQLPAMDTDLDNMQSFFAQSGDYMHMLIKKAAVQGDISEEDRQNIKLFGEYSGKLAESLVIMRDIVNRENKPEAVADVLSVQLKENGGVPPIGNIGEVEQIFMDYPKLIYDGPFSAHLTSKTYLMIENAEEVSQEKAREIAAAFMKAQIDTVVDDGATNSNMSTYNFRCGSTYISVSQKGGFVSSMMTDRTPGNQTVSDEDAVNRARSFLNEKGYSNMEETYYVANDGVLTVNFAAEQDGVTLYPDLIKIGVALDTGGIVFFESAGYLQNHQERDLPAAVVLMQNAREKLSSRLTVYSEGMALIPTESKEEAYCYEFKCVNPEGKDCIIYINALTGEEQDILVIIDTGHGKLTM